MIIRDYQEGDYKHIINLIRVIYNDKIAHKMTQRFQWQYQDNPFYLKGDPTMMVLEENKTILGLLGAYPLMLKVQSQVVKAFWVGDFMVHPQSRQGQKGIDLARTITNMPYLMVGFPAPYTMKIWLRFKLIPFVQLIRISTPFNEKHQTISKLNRLSKFLEKSLVDHIQVKKINKFDQKADDLWQRASMAYSNIQVRDSRFLNWRFVQCPYIQYEILAAVQESKMLGYIVLRCKEYPNHKEGHIVDFLLDQSTLKAGQYLIAEAMHFFGSHQCHVVKTVLNKEDKLLRNILTAYGFDHEEIIDKGIYSNNLNASLNEILTNSRQWFITEADSDMDFSDDL